MKLKWDTALTVTLVTCALITTGLVIRRELFAPSVAVRQPEQKPVLIDNWRAQLDKGVLLGRLSAPVQLIEFADFECPFCASLHKTLKAVRARYPMQVALIYVHFPIPGHRFAIPAARVAECAAEQGRFEAMHDQLFEAQESFGLKTWSEYASAAGVANLSEFDTCVNRTDPIQRVEDGKQFGKALNVQATPTLIVNGWKLGRPPTEDELDRMVKAVLAGKNPISAIT
jgi:protein-disulfide isomerase